MKTDIKKYRLYKRKGSLSIEAALVLPVFLFMMICIISLLSLLLFQMRLKECMHEEVKIAAMESINKGFPNEAELGEKVISNISDYILKIAPIENGYEGIYFSEAGTDREVLILSATYETKLYYDMFGLFHKIFTQKCVQHSWEGYLSGLRTNISDKEEEYVYITHDSEVYHLNRECSHLKLKIEAVESSMVLEKRNNSGAKYYSCEHCKSKLSDGLLYITSDGDKYHNSLSCSGLKRTVMMIPKSEIEGKRVCQRCGGH